MCDLRERIFLQPIAERSHMLKRMPLETYKQHTQRNENDIRGAGKDLKR